MDGGFAPRRTIAGRNPVADALGLHAAPVLRTDSPGNSGMAFVELKFDRENAGLTQAVQEDAFLIALQLVPCHDFDLYADGRLIQPEPFDPGDVAIFDLRTNLASDLRDSFHAVDLYLPQRALDGIAAEAGVPRIDELRHRPGGTFDDPVLRNLLLSMRPSLAARPAEVAPLMVDHVANAIAIHVAHTYGGMHARGHTRRGGLAPWQERRAKELLHANLSGRISLGALAAACELSVRHFTRAFRQSTSVSPHEWLQQHRLERAKELLARSSMHLAEIALDCGFADQSHFSRKFQRAVGATPGNWRRAWRG
ncbi:MAG: AraC family transcriptional regulator [Proteobacteria bacterium]|nr:MAG: AraC family transcriptional regulator [Pseudomonadota bacterium]